MNEAASGVFHLDEGHEHAGPHVLLEAVKLAARHETIVYCILQLTGPLTWMKGTNM
jgi:hypothetical protein